MRHVLDKSSDPTTKTALRWAYAMRRRAMPAKATLILQRRKRTPHSALRSQQFLRIDRGLEA